MFVGSWGTGGEGGGLGAEMGSRYQTIKENVCVGGRGGMLWRGSRYQLIKEKQCVSVGGSGAEMGRRYQLIKENNVCVWGGGWGGVARWAGDTILSKKTICVFGGGGVQCCDGQQVPTYQRKEGGGWRDGQQVPTYQRKQCVSIGGSGAEMGRRYQLIKENNVCVCWVVCLGGGGGTLAEMGRRYQLTKENNVCVLGGGGVEG